MAKEITGQIKLQIPAGQANPAPPVGPALGQQGVNIMAFCKEFNAATQKQAGDILPVVITVYKDKSFTFITKSPPAGVLLKKAAGIASGSKEPNKVKVAKLTKKQVMDLVKIKMKDMNARSEEAAFRTLCGTARQMGIEIEAYSRPRLVFSKNNQPQEVSGNGDRSHCTPTCNTPAANVTAPPMPSWTRRANTP